MEWIYSHEWSEWVKHSPVIAKWRCDWTKGAFFTAEKFPEWRGNCPKRHLGQKSPSKRKVGEYSFSEVQFSLWGIIFSWRLLSFSLRIFCFPMKRRVWAKGSFYGKRGTILIMSLLRDGKFTSNNFLPQKIRDFLKALETTTAMKRRNILCTFCSDCAVFNLSLQGRCISPSLQDSAKVAISRLLARNCCSLVTFWWSLWVQFLPLNDGQVEKSSFHGRCHFGTLVGGIGTLKSRSFMVCLNFMCCLEVPQKIPKDPPVLFLEYGVWFRSEFTTLYWNYYA